MARSVLALLAAPASAFCVLRNKTVCWGNEHQYVERTEGASPFHGMTVSSASPALADLDGDGDLDLVVGQNGDFLSYYENVGNATSPGYVEVTSIENPFHDIDLNLYTKPAFGDVDGDDDLDLVVGEQNGDLYYYNNSGNATSPSYVAVKGIENPFDDIEVSENSAPALADLDDDGDLDLVAGDVDGRLSYYENVGSAASPSYEAAIGSANLFHGIDVGDDSAPAFADVDGDGDLDLVVGDYDGRLLYYENVGSAAAPSYEARTGSASPFDGIDLDENSAPAFGDLDGDDDLDLVVGDETGVPGEEIGALNYYEIVGSTAYYYNEIVGSTALPTYAVVTRTAGPFADIDVGSGWERSASAFGDLDGDDDLDLVVGEENGFLYYYENVGNAAAPSYVAVTGSDSPFDGIDVGSKSAPAFGDVDGDGDLDLLVGANNRFLYYYVNFAPTHAPTLAPSPLPTTPAPSPLPTTRIDDDDDDDDAMSVATILFAASGWCVALVVIVAALAVAAKRRRTPPLEPAVAHPTKEAPAAQMA